MTNHFKNMQCAIDAQQLSTHHEHKVGACLHGLDENGSPFTISGSNYWPPLLETHFSKTHKLGNASTTIHAEVALITKAPATENAHIYITSLPCPNCSKMIAESKIKHVYIDTRAHDTALGKKMTPFYENVSKRILQAANINLYEINMTKQSISSIISENPKQLLSIHRPLTQIPVTTDKITEDDFKELIKHHRPKMNFAACFAKTALGQYRFILASSHRSIGLSSDTAKAITSEQEKYQPIIQPINRLILSCSRYGITIDERFLFSSQVPTAREFVNMIGAGFTHIDIEEKNKSRDEHGLEAYKQLLSAKILT